MKLMLVYGMVGLISVLLQDEPQGIGREDRSIYIFLLLFIVVAWPFYWILVMVRWLTNEKDNL